MRENVVHFLRMLAKKLTHEDLHPLVTSAVNHRWRDYFMATAIHITLVFMWRLVFICQPVFNHQASRVLLWHVAGMARGKLVTNQPIACFCLDRSNPCSLAAFQAIR